MGMNKTMSSYVLEEEGVHIPQLFKLSFFLFFGSILTSWIPVTSHWAILLNIQNDPSLTYSFKLTL